MNGESSYRRFLDGDDNGIIEIVRDYKDGLMLYINSLEHRAEICYNMCGDKNGKK